MCIFQLLNGLFLQFTPQELRPVKMLIKALLLLWIGTTWQDQGLDFITDILERSQKNIILVNITIEFDHERPPLYIRHNLSNRKVRVQSQSAPPAPQLPNSLSHILF